MPIMRGSSSSASLLPPDPAPRAAPRGRDKPALFLIHRQPASTPRRSRNERPAKTSSTSSWWRSIEASGVIDPREADVLRAIGIDLPDAVAPWQDDDVAAGRSRDRGQRGTAPSRSTLRVSPIPHAGSRPVACRPVPVEGPRGADRAADWHRRCRYRVTARKGSARDRPNSRVCRSAGRSDAFTGRLICRLPLGGRPRRYRGDSPLRLTTARF